MGNQKGEWAVRNVHRIHRMKTKILLGSLDISKETLNSFNRFD